MNAKEAIRGLLQRKKHPHPRKTANWLVEQFTSGNEVWCINATVPIDPRILSCTKQRDWLIVTGLVTSLGDGAESWLLSPTPKLLKYLNTYAESDIDLTDEEYLQAIKAIDVTKDIKYMI